MASGSNTASLPADEVERLFAVLRSLKARGVGMIYVSHRLDEIFKLADRVAVFNDGKIVQVGEPHEIYEFPNSKFVAEFIGSVNMFEGRLVEDLPDHVRIKSDELGSVIYVDHGISAAPGATAGSR
mgnify:CR=1 FL=1